MQDKNNLINQINNKIKEINKVMTEFQSLIEDLIAENRVLQLYKEKYLESKH